MNTRICISSYLIESTGEKWHMHTADMCKMCPKKNKSKIKIIEQSYVYTYREHNYECANERESERDTNEWAIVWMYVSFIVMG